MRERDRVRYRDGQRERVSRRLIEREKDRQNSSFCSSHSALLDFPTHTHTHAISRHRQTNHRPDSSADSADKKRQFTCSMLT